MKKQLQLTYFFLLFFAFKAAGQCDKNYFAYVGHLGASSSWDLSVRTQVLFCEGDSIEMALSFITENMIVNLYKDSVFEKRVDSKIAYITKEGVYHVEVLEGECNYRIGLFDVKAKTNFPLSLNVSEMVICGNNTYGFGYIYPQQVAGFAESINTQYKWFKEGELLEGENYRVFYPKSEGKYSVMAITANCAATSLPVNVISKPEVIINANIRNDDINKDGVVITKDTVLLCSQQLNQYKLTTSIPFRDFDWYKNDEQIDNGKEITLKESGKYYGIYKVDDACTIKTKPVYINFGEVIDPPFTMQKNDNIFLCNRFYTETVNNPNIFPNVENTLSISYENIQRSFVYKNIKNGNYFSLESGQNKIQFQSGECRSEDIYITAKKPILNLNVNDTTEPTKKYTLCPNQTAIVSTSYYKLFDGYKTKIYLNDRLLDNENYLVENYFHNSYFITAETGKYHIVMDDTINNCVLYSDTIEIVIPESIPRTLTTQITGTGDCTNASVKLTASKQAGYTYTWLKDNNVIPNQTSAELILNNTSDYGTYQGFLSKGTCIIPTESYIIENEKNGSVTLCEGTTYTLQSNIKNANKYQWQLPSGETRNGYQLKIDSLKEKDAGKYVLTTTKNGCTYSGTYELKITPKTDIKAAIVSPMCVGQPIVLNVKAEVGDISLSLNYKYGNGFKQHYYYLNSSGEDNFMLPELYNSGELSQMKITATKNACSVNVPIETQPNLTEEQCKDILTFTNVRSSYCSGSTETITFSKPASIPADTKFKLYLNHDKILLATSTTTSFTFTNPSNLSGYSTFFIIESEDGKWKAYSQSFIFQYVSNYISYNYPATHCEGFSTTISYDPYYENQFSTYQWFKDSSMVEGETNKIIKAKDAGTYYLQIKTPEECTVNTNSVNVTVGEIPKVSIYGLLGNSACKGYKIPVTIYKNSFPYTAYEIIKDEKTITKTDSLDTFDVSESGYYKVKAYQGNCQSVSDSKYFTVDKLPPTFSIYGHGEEEQLFENGELIKCDSMSVYMFINGILGSQSLLDNYGVKVNWFRNNQIDKEGAKLITQNEGKYFATISQGDCLVKTNTLEIKNKQGIFSSLFYGQKDVVKCDIQGGFYLYDIFWKWDKKLYRNDTLQADNNYIGQSGKYYAIYNHYKQPNCIAYSDTVNIKFSNDPIIYGVDTVYTCLDTMTIGYRTLTDELYSWEYEGKVISDKSLLKATKGGNYIFHVKKNNNCEKIYNYFIIKKLDLKLYHEKSDFCNVNESFIYFSNFSSFESDSAKLDLYKDNQLIKSEYSKELKYSYIPISLPISQSGVYRAKIDVNGCKGESNEVKVNFVNFDTSLSPAKDSLGVCPNSDFPTLVAHEDASYQYQWFKENVPLTTAASSTLKPTETGTYRVFLEKDGCIDVTPPIKIYTSTERPTAMLSGDTLIAKGEKTNLKIDFTSSPPFSYKLNNGESGTANKNTIQHPVVAEENRTYELQSVSNGCGEGTVSGTAKIQVIILGNEPSWAESVKLYPIPTIEWCRLEFSLEKPEKVVYQLISSTGKVLQTKELGIKTTIQETIDLSSFPVGEYLLNLQIGEKRLARKVIKR